MDTIAKMTALEEIRLSNTIVSDRGLARLSTLKKLISIHLAETQASPAGLSWLADCEAVEFLDLQGSKKVTDGIVEILVVMPKLIQVNLKNTSCSRSAIR